MTKVRVKLKYPQLAAVLQKEANQRKIDFRSYPISFENLSIDKQVNQLLIRTTIISKWSASLTLKLDPQFLRDEMRMNINDVDIDFKTENIIFKGLLKIMKGRIIKRFEKIAEEPLQAYIDSFKILIDNELKESKLPYDLNLTSETKKLDLQDLIFNEDHLLIEFDLDQHLQISFEELETPELPIQAD